MVVIRQPLGVIRRVVSLCGLLPLLLSSPWVVPGLDSSSLGGVTRTLDNLFVAFLAFLGLLLFGMKESEGGGMVTTLITPSGAGFPKVFFQK